MSTRFPNSTKSWLTHQEEELPPAVVVSDRAATVEESVEETEAVDVDVVDLVAVPARTARRSGSQSPSSAVS